MLRALTEVVDRLVEAGPQVLSDGESIEDLHRELARLDALVTTATAAFDSSRDWEADGAKTASAWLATRCRLPRSVAGRRVRLGRKLRHLPVCEQAWLAGEITADHVATIAAVRRDETEEALARAEKLLVDNARQLRFETFARTVAYWEQLADPDGAEDDEHDRTSRRDVYLAESFRGMFFGKMTLDPISGATVAAELGRRERALFEIDWAEAKARLGREPTIADLVRTPGQRRADALVEMATRSATAPVDGRRPAPLFSVLVGYETLHGRICELANGTPVAPGALVPWLDQACIERAVFGLGRRVEISVTSRLFTGATRRGLDLRDRQCTHEFCDQPAARCQGDHVVPYAEGGLTTQENGQLLCGYHNRLKPQRPPPVTSDA
jgi:hypothetical protein